MSNSLEPISLLPLWGHSHISRRAFLARRRGGEKLRRGARCLVQYNTDAGEWSLNVRFNIIHHLLSDFFLVFNQRRDTDTGGLLDRAVVAKMTYLLAF